ncbi:MAG: response regulator transcription factor [Planctomycetota bacterium]
MMTTEAPQKHILVVDDEEHLAIGIKYNLEAEGYRVTAVGNGVDALDRVTKEDNPIDLIVLDLMLPGMSGYEVCEKVRAAGRFMPILMLSARTLSEDKTRGFDVGANQYLVKPFELEELLSRIKNLLIQSGSMNRPDDELPAEIEEYSFGDAKINFKTYEIRVAEKPVRLTELQIRVLRYFVENEGMVIPRSRLLEDVWNMPGHMNTRAPDQILRQLRKTFEPNSSKPVHFLTIRDAGYRFVREPEDD